MPPIWFRGEKEKAVFFVFAFHCIEEKDKNKAAHFAEV